MSSTNKTLIGLTLVAVAAAVALAILQPPWGVGTGPRLPIDQWPVCAPRKRTDCRLEREATVEGTREMMGRGRRHFWLQMSLPNGRRTRAELPSQRCFAFFKPGDPVRLWLYNRRVLEVSGKGVTFTAVSHPHYRLFDLPFWRWYAGMCLTVGTLLAIAFLLGQQPQRTKSRR